MTSVNQLRLERFVKIMDGGQWYPQVMGIEDGLGTDKIAGRWARFFTGGTSDHLIQFIK